MRFRTLAFLISACLLPVAAQAQQGLRYAVDERFAVINEEVYSDLNVSFQPVLFEQLPPFLQNQMALMAHKCTSSNENAYRIKAYSYTSENTRRRKLPPNYILDTLPLAKEKMTPCSFPPLCEDGLCRLIGFQALGDTWTRSFSLPVKGWEVKSRLYPGTSMPQTYLSALTLDPECKENGGIENMKEAPDAGNEQCRYNYLWAGNGLSLLPFPDGLPARD